MFRLFTITVFSFLFFPQIGSAQTWPSEPPEPTVECLVIEDIRLGLDGYVDPDGIKTDTTACIYNTVLAKDSDHKGCIYTEDKSVLLKLVKAMEKKTRVCVSEEWFYRPYTYAFKKITKVDPAN